MALSAADLDTLRRAAALPEARLARDADDVAARARLVALLDPVLRESPAAPADGDTAAAAPDRLASVTFERPAGGGITATGSARFADGDGPFTASWGADGVLSGLELRAPSDDAPLGVALGGKRNVTVTTSRIAWSSSKDGRFAVRFVGAVEAAGVSLAVSVRASAEGAWVVDACRDATVASALVDSADEGAPAEIALDKALSTAGVGLGDVRAFLDAVIEGADLRVDRLQLGLRENAGGVAFWRIKVGGASPLRPWALVPGVLEVDKISLDLALRYAERGDSSRLDATLDGDVRVRDTALKFRLTRKAALWELAPREPIALDVKGLLSWIGATALAEGAPDWGSPTDGLAVDGLALAVDLSKRGAARVATLRGEVVKRGEFALPLLGDRGVVRDLAIGVRVDAPFDAPARATTLSFRAALALKLSRDGAATDFALEGSYAAKAWSLKASTKGQVSLSGALDALVGLALDDQATSLLGDYDLSLDQPSLSLGSGGTVAFEASVLLQRRSNPGGTFDVGVGALTLFPGQIVARRGEKRASYGLSLGLALAFDGGPAIERCTLRVKHDTGRKGALTTVALSTALVFPQKPDEEPVRVDLFGEYKSGKSGGFAFKGTATEVPLNPVIDGMIGLIGQSLPDDFPRLAATRLSLRFDTSDGSYEASGTATAAPFRVKDTLVSDATFTFRVRSSCKKGAARETGVALQGKAKIGAMEVGLTLRFDGKSTDVVAVASDVSAARFAKEFPDAASGGPDVSGDGDVRLAAAGFRYRSEKRAAKADEAGDAAPSTSFALLADVGGVGRFDVAAAMRNPKEGYKPFFLMRPKVSWLAPGAAVGWSGAPFKKLPLCPDRVPGLDDDLASSAYDARVGLFATAVFELDGTAVGRALGIRDGIEIAVEDGDLAVRPKRRAAPGLPASAESAAKPAEIAAKPADAPAKPAEEREGEKTFRLEKTLSLATVINAVSPSKDDGKAKGSGGWRALLGNALVVSNPGITLRSKPKPGVTVFADVGLNVGSWVSVAVQGLAVSITPRKGLTGDLRTDFDVDGVALSLDLQPWIRGAAAVARDRSDTDGITVVGLGEFQLLKKVRVGALAYLRFAKKGDDHALDAGFGFIFATGMMVPLPPSPVVLTGIAGGFGYNAVPRLPSRAEDVADNALLQLLRGGEATDRSAKAMLDRLDGFRRSVDRAPGAWCVVVGVTLTVARAVDCAVLAVVEGRPSGLEVAVMGVADFTLGAKPGSGGTTLGRVQLSLLARWSSAAASVIVLGAITGDSWIFDEKCRLQGGFALCVWYGGPNAGDFLLSIGGYSPLAPRRAHYPALDRVGLKWRVSDALSLYGEAYLTLDRYSVQLGCAAGLSYRTSKVKLEAHFSFDAIVEWAPLYYEARMRLSVHVEIKVVVTLRLGLDVDVHLWGPPFGAEVRVEVELWPFNPSFTVAVGSDYEEAQFERRNVAFDRVVELAAGAKDASTLKLLAGDSPGVLTPGSAQVTPAARAHRFVAERASAADAVALSLESAIPLTELRYGADGARHTAGGERGLEVRPKRWSGLSSSLTVTVFELVMRSGAEVSRRPVPTPWELGAVRGQPLESLWSIAKDKSRPWEVERAELITAAQVTPPSSNTGDRFDAVRLRGETTRAPAPAATREAAPPTLAAATVDAVGGALDKDRAALRGALADLGFAALAGCATRGFRPLEAAPLRIDERRREVAS